MTLEPRILIAKNNRKAMRCLFRQKKWRKKLILSVLLCFTFFGKVETAGFFPYTHLAFLHHHNCNNKNRTKSALPGLSSDDGAANLDLSRRNKVKKSTDDGIHFFSFPKWHWKKLKSNEELEKRGEMSQGEFTKEAIFNSIQQSGITLLSLPFQEQELHSKKVDLNAAASITDIRQMLSNLWMDVQNSKKQDEGQQSNQEIEMKTDKIRTFDKSKTDRPNEALESSRAKVSPETKHHHEYIEDSQTQPVHIVQQENNEMRKNGNKTVQLTLHTYHYPPLNITLHGLSLTLPKFKAWIGYMLKNYYTFKKTNSATALFHMKAQTRKLLNDTSSASFSQSDINQYIVSENITINTEKRNELRRMWFDRLLVSDRTEILASYPSNAINQGSENVLERGQNLEPSSCTHGSHSDMSTTNTRKGRRKKRGGFDDLLSVYADRLMSILKDEQNSVILEKCKSIDAVAKNGFVEKMSIIGETSYASRNTSGQNNSTLIHKSQSEEFNLTSWLLSEYGHNETEQLMHRTFSKMQQDEQFKTMQHFLDWFRNRFPYYYDRCDSCNASFRDDDNNGEINDEIKDESDTAEEIIDGTFLGYMYPSPEEIKSGASRVELYHCHKCNEYTRFPRYNIISSIVKYGRGRCGEYSILVYRTLRELGFHARWVIDWSDHVWVEFWLASANNAGRWIHIDPCEAACDQPHLYQSWGKKATFIIAFWLPKKDHIAKNANSLDSTSKDFRLIEDVTLEYTSDSLDVVQSRREESLDSVLSSIHNVEKDLKARIKNLTIK